MQPVDERPLCHMCSEPMTWAPCRSKPGEPYYCYPCGERYVQGPVSAGQEMRVVNHGKAVELYRVEFGGRQVLVCRVNPAEFEELAKLLHIPAELPRSTRSAVRMGLCTVYAEE